MEVSVQVQCNEEEIDYETLNHYSFQRELPDILEDDEECSPASQENEQMLNPFNDSQTVNASHGHLSILSLDKMSNSASTKSLPENVSVYIHLLQLFSFKKKW